jgi:tetratricopeptide (TPR) repeat protein
MCLVSLGYCAHFQGIYVEALDYFEEGLAIMRKLDEPRTTAVFIGSLSYTLRALGRISETKTLLQEALALATQLEDTWTIANTYEQMGVTAAHAQEVAEAQYYLERAIALFGECGDAWHWTDALNHVGWLYAQVGDTVQAQQRFAEALRLATAAQLAPNALNALVGLATVQAKSTPTAVHLAIAYCALIHSASTQEIKTHAEALRLQIEAEHKPHEIEAARLRAQRATLESLGAEIAGVS